MLLQYRMSGRPRGRPRKDGSDPVPRPKVVKDEPVDEPAQSPLSKRSSPRKRKPTNFDGFVVEAPGLGVIGEGADIIKEIEEVSSFFWLSFFSVLLKKSFLSVIIYYKSNGISLRKPRWKRL